MKKKIAGLLAACMCMTLFAACTSSAGTSSNGDSAAQGEKVTLVVWGEESQQALYEDAFAEINKRFMEAHPNITVDYQFSGSMESLNVAVQTDSLPDIFYSQGNKMTTMAEMVKNGFLLPLNQFNIDTSRFPQDSIDYATVDGELYCSLPSFLDYSVIYYNKDIYAQYGLEKPATWDEFVENCRVLAENGVTPLAFGGNNWLDRYWFFGAEAITFCDDEMLAIAAGEKPEELPGLTKGFEVYSDFAANGYFGADFIGSDMAGSQLTFTNGNAAMILDGSWNNVIYADSGLNVGRFALPDNDGKRYAQTGPSQSTTYSISAKTAHPEEAALYIEYLCSQEVAQIMYDSIGMIPVVDDVTIDDPDIAEMAEFDVIGQNIYNVLALAGTKDGQPADLLVNDLLPKLLSGEYTPEQATDLLIAEMAR